VRGCEYWSILDNLDWVQRYARLYSISEATESVTSPAAPCDWARTGSLRLGGPIRREVSGGSLHVV
jgi:beta-glucosidase